MKSYYLHQEDGQHGPYSIAQLKKMQLSPTMPVWTEGLPSWVQAERVPELRAALFLPSGDGGVQGRIFVPRTEGIEYMLSKSWKGTLIAATLVMVAFIVFRMQNAQSYHAAGSITDSEQPVEAKKDLRQKEKQHPEEYIGGKIASHINARGETVLQGSLINRATIINYKDPVIVISLFSKDNTPIEKLRYTINKELAAGQSISYQYTIRPRYKVETVEAVIESAGVAE